MDDEPTTLPQTALHRFLSSLSFPKLFVLFLVLLLLDSVIPDPLPFVDELGLLVLTVMLGSFRKRGWGGGQTDGGATPKPPEKNVTPKGASPQPEEPEV